MSAQLTLPAAISSLPARPGFSCDDAAERRNRGYANRGDT
jgi:hypothetical protein